MKFKLNERGFILTEFVMALPILILLLYALGTLTLKTARIAREQVADYVLETEAQEVIDRITQDARAACRVEIRKAVGDINPNLENIFFMCDTLTTDIRETQIDGKTVRYFKEIINPKIYFVDNAQGDYFHVYFKHQDNKEHNNPITGKNSYGNTVVTQMKFSGNFLEKKILHITFEMKSLITNQKVKFTTAIYMPACEEIIYCGEKIL